jgi:nucleotide-binding universal stress UspA family protein
MIEIGHILCPIDFSELSTRALRHAVVLARWYGAEIHGLHVVPAHPTLWPVSPHLGRVREEPPHIQHLRKEVDGLLDGARVCGVQARAYVAQGDAATRILEHARHTGIDWIVMGTHGRSRLERAVLGSVAESVLREASCGVLTVAGSQAPPLAGRPPFQRILCPVDFTPASLGALRAAAALASDADAELTLLHVIAPGADAPALRHVLSGGEPQRALEARVRARLYMSLPDESRESCRTCEVVGTGSVPEEILRVARESRAELIVMGVHGRPLLGPALFGSNASAVVSRASCPVLTFTGPAAEAPAPVGKDREVLTESGKH